jgi:aryl-alcohol dehydrogenase-like predicted oxidoreductase
MNLRSLGKTEIRLSPIGLGCWQFSEGRGIAGGFWPALPPDTVAAIVRTSLENGVTWFDTAEAYGGGASEEALSRALSATGKKPGDVVIATKWMPILRAASSITGTIDERLRRLSPFPIDLHQIHAAYGAFSTRGAQLDRMAELVAQKKIRAIGISNYNARQMRAAHARLQQRGLTLASNQMRYSLLDRKIESNGVMTAAKELGVTIIAYSPLAQGALTGRFHDDPDALKKLVGPRKWMSDFRPAGLAKSRPVIEALKRIAEKKGANPAQVALAWLVAFHGDTVVAIPGASSERQASSNAGAMKLELSPEELRELDEVSRPFL